MNIYVGNLSPEVTQQDLRQLFLAFGHVSRVTVLKGRFTSASRGFGFVEMPIREEAQAAIAGLNGRELKGRSIIVDAARSRTEEHRGGLWRGGGYHGGKRPF